MFSQYKYLVVVCSQYLLPHPSVGTVRLIPSSSRVASETTRQRNQAIIYSTFITSITSIIRIYLHQSTPSIDLANPSRKVGKRIDTSDAFSKGIDGSSWLVFSLLSPRIDPSLPSSSFSTLARP